MPHRDRGIPIIGDIPLAPGAPGPGQGGPPVAEQGFGPRQRAKRLLRQAAGLQPPSDVQPASGRAPAIEAALNLQLAEGLISQEQFAKATGRVDPTTGLPLPGTISEVAGVSRRAAAPAGAASAARRRSLRTRARQLRARKAGLIAGATQAASGPLGATPGLLPQITDLFSRRRTF